MVPLAPRTTVETPVLIETGLSRSHRSVRGAVVVGQQGRGGPRDRPAAGEHDGRAASAAAASTSRASAASTRALNAENDSSYSSSWSPEVQRSVASLEPALEGGLLRLALRSGRLVVHGQDLDVVELVPAGVDVDVGSPARTGEEGRAAVWACRLISPVTTHVGR